jgi:hypothetical protein
LDHDHVWELLMYISREPDSELVAIAERQPKLAKQAKSQVPDSVKFYADYVAMLDEAVIVTTTTGTWKCSLFSLSAMALRIASSACEEELDSLRILSLEVWSNLGAAQKPKPMVRGVRSNHVSQIVVNRLTVLKHIENSCDEGNWRDV